MIPDTYPYERPFRLRILAACLHNNWYANIGTEVVLPEYFNTKEEQALLRFINKFYLAYHRAPKRDELLAEYSDADELELDLLDEIADIPSEELEYAKAKAVEFARTQALWIATDKGITLFKQGKGAGDIWPLFVEADKVGKDINDLGIDLVDDVDQWLLPESVNESERISTGLSHLDQATKGGLGRGEYGLLLAPTNGGKTTTLINIGFGASTLISKANTLHISLEMSAKEIATRYASRVTGIPYDHDVDLNHYLDEFDQSVNLRLRGRIRIKDFARLSISELIMYLDTLDMQGFRPDVLIVDYADLITIDPRREYRFELTRIAAELRALAVERDMAVWSASQVQRGASSRELIGIDHIAEAYGKGTVADLILSVNMSGEEKDACTSRLYCAKTRLNRTKSGWIVQCKYDIDSCTLESTNYMTYSEWLELKSENGNKQLQIIK